MWNFKKLLDFSDKTVIITGGAGLLGSIWATVEYVDLDIVLALALTLPLPLPLA